MTLDSLCLKKNETKKINVTYKKILTSYVAYHLENQQQKPSIRNQRHKVFLCHRGPVVESLRRDNAVAVRSKTDGRRARACGRDALGVASAAALGYPLLGISGILGRRKITKAEQIWK